MRFDIEGFITFDTEDASLVNLLTGDCIELSATSSRLLARLLQHRGDILSRVDIFQTVFDQYGARASNSNLNQYISTLRRNLSDLGIEKDVIITVPRVGFKVSDEVIVTTDNDYDASWGLAETSPVVPRVRRPWWNYLAFTLIPVFICGLFITFAAGDPGNHPEMTKITQGKCVIYAPMTLASPEILKTISTHSASGSRLDCSVPKELYIFKRQVHGQLGSNIQLLLMECETRQGKCTSYYYREKKNA
ncbi:winged helix-turn-helix domain-containing protein [Entomohabitans teleogrylli]|uniref:winged helix-turn-helix domain-containing protein n=1 Tax=Entomohabitans teleogrylli TaxID=1384589 RepID=UPI00073D3A1B|nr:helix-turn-helix domain-containing protein [Entomohabitans teleogrylli]